MRKARQTVSREGHFVDQTDVPGDTVDVNVTDRRVTAVGRYDRAGAGSDAAGPRVTSGFIEMHTRTFDAASCTSVRRWYRQLARVIAVVPGIPKGTGNGGVERCPTGRYPQVRATPSGTAV